MLSPLFDVLLFRQHGQRLPVHCINQARNELTRIINLLHLVHELLCLFLELHDAIWLLEVVDNIFEKTDGLKPDLIVQVLFRLTFLDLDFFDFRKLLLTLVSTRNNHFQLLFRYSLDIE